MFTWSVTYRTPINILISVIIDSNLYLEVKLNVWKGDNVRCVSSGAMEECRGAGLGSERFVLFSKLFSREQNTSHYTTSLLTPARECRFPIFIVYYNS